jgi:hypothetical protein
MRLRQLLCSAIHTIKYWDKSVVASSADTTAQLIIFENVNLKWNCCAHLKMTTCGLCIKKYAQDYFAIVISVLLTNFK